MGELDYELPHEDLPGDQPGRYRVEQFMPLGGKWVQVRNPLDNQPDEYPTLTEAAAHAMRLKRRNLDVRVWDTFEDKLADFTQSVQRESKNSAYPIGEARVLDSPRPAREIYFDISAVPIDLPADNPARNAIRTYCETNRVAFINDPVLHITVTRAIHYVDYHDYHHVLPGQSWCNLETHLGVQTQDIPARECEFAILPDIPDDGRRQRPHLVIYPTRLIELCMLPLQNTVNMRYPYDMFDPFRHALEAKVARWIAHDAEITTTNQPAH